MYISEIQLINYKSYLISETVNLSPGLNVIVGQNHAGKTALLEGLGLNFSNKSYRGSGTRRRAYSKEDNWSSAIVSFTISRDELMEILRDLPSDFGVPLPNKEKYITMEQLPEYQHVLNFIVGVIKHDQFTFQVGVDSSGDKPQIAATRFPAWGLYEAGGSRDRRSYAFCRITEEGKLEFVTTQDYAPDTFDLGLTVADTLRERIYSFQAERFSLASAKTGNNTVLASDASNLAEVLENLQGRNPGKFRLLNEYVRDVFPQVYEVSVRHDRGNAMNREVVIYEEKSLDEEDAVPLADSGTGIGQVLAMLYVLVSSKYPQTIIIDEPQSFLHPGAVRKLFEILNVHSQHQYIIATHLPNVIAASDPSQIILVQKKPAQESHLRVIDKNDTEELRLTLHDVGARLSDVFGADSILWVEGPTERDCFPLILQKLRPERLRGTEFVPVLSVDETLGRGADRVIRIYDRLSKGQNLLPPAIGFIFDRECRHDVEITDLERYADRTVRFIKRRMYENYLLKPKAIEAVLLELGLRAEDISASAIEKWLEQEIEKPENYCKKLPNKEPWVVFIDGSNILRKLFAHFSNTKLSYEKRKVEYGVKLTQWLLENDPRDLTEIADTIHSLLAERKSEGV